MEWPMHEAVLVKQCMQVYKSAFLLNSLNNSGFGQLFIPALKFLTLFFHVNCHGLHRFLLLGKSRHSSDSHAHCSIFNFSIGNWGLFPCHVLNLCTASPLNLNSKEI